MGISIFKADANSGYTTKELGAVLPVDPAVYIVAHDAPSASRSIFPPLAPTKNYIITETGYFKYGITRGLLSFDTSLLGGVAISAANIYIIAHDATESDPGQSDLHIVRGVQHTPPINTDYGDEGLQVTSGGVCPFGSYLLGWIAVIPFNAFGLGQISPSGTTKLGLRLSGDITASVPTGYNRVDGGVGVDADGWPHTYAMPVTGITSTSATLSVLLATGGPAILEIDYTGVPLPYPIYRFKYQRAGVYPTLYTPWETVTSEFPFFTRTITGLVPSAGYYWTIQYQHSVLDPVRESVSEVFHTLASPIAPTVTTLPATGVS